jgi:hypothetical protein
MQTFDAGIVAWRAALRARVAVEAGDLARARVQLVGWNAIGCFGAYPTLLNVSRNAQPPSASTTTIKRRGMIPSLAYRPP